MQWGKNYRVDWAWVVEGFKYDGPSVYNGKLPRFLNRECPNSV